MSYRQYRGEDYDDHAKLPRCDNLDGSTLRIVHAYTEAGMFCEAQCVTIEDAEGRKAVYVPYSIDEGNAG